jgi:hypothetical protein
MSEDSGGAPRPRAAWRHHAWVAGLMHFPDDSAQLENIATGGNFPFTPGTEFHLSWRASLAKANYAGYIAGAVLAMLYALERAGWDLPREPKPSLTVAIHCAAAAGMEIDRARTTPEGRAWADREKARGAAVDRWPRLTTLGGCWRRMQSVAHLWAVPALHRWGLMGSHTADWRSMYSSDAGARVLLATAHSVQLFAQGWRDPMHGTGGLLGPDPWLVPLDTPLLPPIWPEHPPCWPGCRREWLVEALESYQRPKRASRPRSFWG